MSCWERTWQIVQVQREFRRIDREIEVLRQSLYEHVVMSSDALSNLLGLNITGSVETRVALDGHDVEVKLEDGIWRTVDPQTLTVPSLLTPSNKHILELNTSEVVDNQKRDAIYDLLDTSNAQSRDYRLLFADGS